MKEKRLHFIVIIIVAISLLSISVLLSPFEGDLWDLNSKLLNEKVLSIGETVETVNLSHITPFEWDVVYSFGPYTPKDMVYDAIGYKWDDIRETVSEGMDQIVFLKDGKVVCYLYGYPANNGYSMVISGKNYRNVATVLNIKDNLSFQVTRSDGVLYLKHTI
jgi:hypothetical protein